MSDVRSRVVEPFVAAVEKHLPGASVVAYGSLVRGDLVEGLSDINLLVVAPDLGPPGLDRLAPAVRRYAERYEQYTGLPCLVSVQGEPLRLPSRTEISVYRLMQEALQNASVHGQARHTEVALVFETECLRLVVMDDGRGFDLTAVQRHNSGHLGLLGMQERAESLGGHLTITTAPDAGTAVTLTVPIPAATEEMM